MLDDLDKEHARLSPSSAARWARCPASIRMTAKYGVDSINEAGALGTILHGIMEKCLKQEGDPYDFVGKSFTFGVHTFEITAQQAAMLSKGLDMIDDIPGKLYVEKRVSLSRWLPGQFGTLDVGIIGKRRIVIFDHKFGMIPVNPDHNYQLQLYALGFWHTIARKVTDVKDFRLIIWQPTTSSGGGMWDTTLDELLDFGTEMRWAAKRCDDPKAEHVPGPEQCRYCAGAETRKCEAFNKYNLELFVEDFAAFDEDVEYGLPIRMPHSTITPERRSYLIDNTPQIKKWLDGLYADALADAQSGITVPGKKLVRGRLPPRRWNDEEAAREFLFERLGPSMAIKRSIVSPTEAEELFTKKKDTAAIADMDEYVEYGERPLTLDNEYSNKPAVKSVFDELCEIADGE